MEIQENMEQICNYLDDVFYNFMESSQSQKTLTLMPSILDPIESSLP